MLDKPIGKALVPVEAKDYNPNSDTCIGCILYDSPHLDVCFNCSPSTQRLQGNNFQAGRLSGEGE